MSKLNVDRSNVFAWNEHDLEFLDEAQTQAMLAKLDARDAAQKLMRVVVPVKQAVTALVVGPYALVYKALDPLDVHRHAYNSAAVLTEAFGKYQAASRDGRYGPGPVKPFIGPRYEKRYT